jgi:hypothetical protein
VISFDRRVNVLLDDVDTNASRKGVRMDRPVRGSAGVHTYVETRNQRCDARVSG